MPGFNTVKFEKGTISVNLEGITVKNAHPALTILVGQEERKIHLIPSNNFDSDEWIRKTPAGRARLRRMKWKSTEGWRFTWIVGEFEDRPGFFAEASFYNGSTEVVRLKDIYLLFTEDHLLTVEGDAEEWWLSSINMPYEPLRMLGNLKEVLASENDRNREFEILNSGEAPGLWGQVTCPPSFSNDEKAADPHWRRFRDFSSLYTNRGERGMTMAAVGDQADIDFEFRVDNGCCKLEVVSRMSDIAVDPGETRLSDTAAFLGGAFNNAADALNMWIASALKARNHRGAVSGWCSWYDLWAHVNAENVLDISHTVSSMHDRINIDVIQTDDGYQKRHGDWDCNDKFLEGMQPIVEAAHTAKVTPGIWMAPIMETDKMEGDLSVKNTISPVHPDWLQRKANGDVSIVLYGNYFIDPTHPQVQDFIKRNLRRMRLEGFRYFKIDYNLLIENTRWHDRKKTRLQVFRDLYRLYRNEIGEDSYLLACVGIISRGVVGFADAARTGPDANPIWSQAFLPENIRDLCKNSCTNGILFANDPDATYTLPRLPEMSLDELRSWHGFVGLLGGMMFISEPLYKPEYQIDESLRMLEIITPAAPEKGRPFHPGVGRQYKRFGFIANRAWGSFASVIVYNETDEKEDIQLDITQSGELGQRFHGWSFWNRKYLGIIDNSYVFQGIPPHASKIVKLTELSDLPVLVGSDLHISMGAAEILNYNVLENFIQIELTDAGARSGSIFLFSSKPVKLEKVDGIKNVEIWNAEENVWELRIDGRQRGSRQKIALVL